MNKLEIFFRENKYRNAKIFIFSNIILYLLSSGVSVNSGFINAGTMISVNIGLLIFGLLGIYRRDKKLISFGLMITLGYNFITYSNQAFSNFSNLSLYINSKGVYGFAEVFEAIAILLLTISMFLMLYSYFVVEFKNYNFLVIIYTIALGLILGSIILNTVYYGLNSSSKVLLAYILGRFSLLSMLLSFIFMFFCLDNRMTPSNINYNSSYYS